MKYYFQRIKNIYHLFQAVLANIWYGFPSRRIKVIGVTGTDGKTTTTFLIYHILKAAGKKVSMISTVYAQVTDKVYETGFHVTTPGPFFVQKMLKQAVDNGEEFFVLETTSHALDQNRVRGIKYKVGVLTNVTHEHLDYHQNYQEYLNTKLKLLLSSKIAVVNADDESYKQIQSRFNRNKIQNYNSKFKIIDKLPELTKFNQYNYSAAYTVCKILNISDEIILNAMKSFKLPAGRMDIVYDKKFKVIIDFAHTPNAFEQVLPEIRRLYLKPKGRLIHVFGSAGLRDFTKRPLMGEASGKYSDLVILTEEDCRTEDPMEICLSISQGLEKQKFRKERIDLSINRYKIFDIIINREEAIKRAIQIAKKGDVVILTGKGHEKSLCRGKKEWPWDEMKTVLSALKIVKSDQSDKKYQ